MLTFPAGTVVSQSAVVEVSGIGLGTFSSSGQTVTYTVTSPTSIPAGVTIRLQVDYIFNPPTPSPVGGYKIQVTTKDPGGATIDSGITSGYQIKQIAKADIAPGADNIAISDPLPPVRDLIRNQEIMTSSSSPVLQDES